MKSLYWLAALPLLGWSLAVGQEQGASGKEPGASQGLVRVGAEDAPGGQVASIPHLDDDTQAAWRKDLTQADLDQREQAFDRLVAKASGDAGLRAWVAELAKGSDDLAWTARLAQRELLERAHSPFQGLLGSPFASHGGMGYDPFAAGDPFQKLFDDPNMDLQGMLRGFGWGPQGPQGTMPPMGQGTSRGESISVQSGPDGVRVEVRTQTDGNEDVKVYEGESMEQLLELHPELKGKVGASSMDIDPLGSQGLLQRVAPQMAPLQQRAVLGVYLDSLALDQGRLVVHQVAPGSLAEHLGVQVGDKLFELDGHALKTRQDIADALADRSDSDLIRLRVQGADGNERMLQWQPDL